MNIYEQSRRNKRDTWVVMLVFVLFFLCVGFGLDYFYGSGAQAPVYTFAGMAIGGITAFAGFAQGDAFVLASSHARPVEAGDEKEAQWQNVVEEMSIAAGLPVPRVYVIDDPDPNAFATGRDPAHASIAATRGLLEKLNREELQGVAAHEMSHVRNFDTRLMLILAVLVGSVALLADWTSRRMLWGRGRDRRREGSSAELLIFVVWLAAAILAPLLSQLMAMCVSRSREYLADAGGAELTRNPLALASALEKIDSATEPTHAISQGTAHLCIADPRSSAVGDQEGRVADLFATHPPIAKRVAALKAMAYAA